MDLKNFNWPTGIFIISYHALLLLLLPLYLVSGLPSLGILITLVMLFALSGLAITAGYHRLYAHKTYKLNKVVESILLFFGTLAVEGSALTWVHDHRNHHKYVDTEKDPYSIKKGFWFAHWGWLFKKPKPLDMSLVKDLEKNWLFKFQHNHYLLLMTLTNTLVIVSFGLLFKDFLGAFVFLFLVRLFTLHHATWFINSLAHTWGSKFYSKEQSAADNWLIAFATFGEGYHNYHHVFPSDYRNGLRWYHFDPAKLFIYGLHKIGLTKNLKKMPSSVIKKRLVLEDKKLVLAKLKIAGKERLQQFETKIHQLSERLHKNLSKIQAKVEKYKTLKRGKTRKQQLLLEIKELRKNVKVDWKAWVVLCNTALRTKPLTT